MSLFRKLSGYSVLPTDEEKAVPTIFDYTSPFIYEDNDKQYRSIFTYQPKFNDQQDYEPDDSGKENITNKLCTCLLIILSYFAIFITAPISLYFVIKIIPKYERLLVFRLGRIQPVKGPGTVCVLPCIDRYMRLDMRIRAFSIPPQQIITEDGAVVEIGAEMRFRIIDGPRTALNVQDLDSSIRLLGRGVLVNRLCRKNVSQLERERIDTSRELKDDMNRTVMNWGLEVTEIELSIVKVLRASEPRSAIGHLVGAVQNMLGQSNQSEVATPEVQRVIHPSITPPSYIEFRLKEVMKLAEYSGQLAHIKAVFELEVVGQHGGFFTIVAENGRCQVSAGSIANRKPDVVITISEEDFEGIFSSDITPLHAYISGRLKVSGDVQLLMSLEAALQAVKKNSKSTVVTV